MFISKEICHKLKGDLVFSTKQGGSLLVAFNVECFDTKDILSQEGKVSKKLKHWGDHVIMVLTHNKRIAKVFQKTENKLDSPTKLLVVNSVDSAATDLITTYLSLLLLGIKQKSIVVYDGDLF